MNIETIRSIANAIIELSKASGVTTDELEQACLMLLYPRSRRVHIEARIEDDDGEFVMSLETRRIK